MKELARDRSKVLTETGARKTDEYRAKQRLWAKNKNPNAVRRWRRNWHRMRYETDPEYREQQRQRSERRRKETYAIPEDLKQWRLYKRRSEHVRRARRRDAGTYTNAEWDELCARYDHRCLCCGEHRPLTVDHVIPLSQGGANTIDNLQPLCLSCNDRKGSRTIDYRYPIGDS
jgi:5-methylcytosine-specific restriction endonuclease McrA